MLYFVLVILFLFSCKIVGDRAIDNVDTKSLTLIMIILCIVGGAVIINLVVDFNETKYFNKQYTYKETITIEPYESYKVNNDTNKFYVLKDNFNIRQLLFFDKTPFGTVKAHSSQDFLNQSSFSKKIKIYESVKDSEINDI